jgi:two-component system alkaline phosphatase synthesis response regulator PhoP
MAKLVYILDDDREICELVKITLEARGYEVDEAYDGEESLAKIKAKKPNLVILDLKMPKLNGYELINAIRTDSKLADLPILVLTSLTKGSSKSDKEWADSLGVADFITKPFEPIDLIKRVEALAK